MPKIPDLFKVLPFDGGYDKWIDVSGPEIDLRVDYDDVNHKRVKNNLRKMVIILNQHWNDSEFGTAPAKKGSPDV